MKKKPQWDDNNWPIGMLPDGTLNIVDESVAEMMKRDAGLGVGNATYADAAPWLPDGDDNWFNAFAALDRQKDKAPLLGLLRSNEPMSNTARHHLADLIDRHVRYWNEGRPHTPSYDRTDREQDMAHAINRVKHLVARKMSVADACEKVAKQTGIGSGTLANAYSSRTGSMARRRKRDRSSTQK